MRNRLHHPRVPIVSITGIDGAGKSSVARQAHLGLSTAETDFSGLEVDRQIHLIHDGEATPIGHQSYDAAASRIDGGNKLLQTFNRARYARAKAGLGKFAHHVADQPIDLLVNVRDPVLDSYVFAGDKLSMFSPAFSLNAFKQVSGAEWPDTTIWIDVDPDLALERIAASYTDRAELGEQSHENAKTLRRMREAYSLAMDAMLHVSRGQVVRVDGSRPIGDVVADVQNVLSDTVASKR